jgi:prophage antirepressor-like protein
MNTDIVSKMFENKEVRYVTINNRPWVVLKDVLHAMETTTRPADAKSQIIQVLGDGVVKSYPILDSMNRVQDTAVVNRDAAMYLVSRGNTDASIRLNRWLFGEVLPDILDTGSYTIPQSPQSQPVGNLTIDQLKSIINDAVQNALPRVQFKDHGVFRPIAGYDVATLVSIVNEKYSIKASIRDGYDMLVASGFVNSKNRNVATKYGIESEIIGYAVTPIIYSNVSSAVGTSKKIIVNTEYANAFVDELFNFVSKRITYTASDRAKMN